MGETGERAPAVTSTFPIETSGHPAFEEAAG
jgi:hypothetical protein